MNDSAIKPYSAFACKLMKNDLNCIYFTMHMSHKGCFFHVFGVIFELYESIEILNSCVVSYSCPINVLIQNFVFVSMHWKSNIED